MKTKYLINILGLATVLSMSLLGCADKNFENSTNNTESGTQSSSDLSVSMGETSEIIPAESTPTEPKGEPTFLIGLDGKPIYTGEISRLEDTNETAETITKDDLGANVYCDGFSYCKEPSGIVYDAYHNPEMFDGYRFTGEVRVNENEWKRIYVGNEICGLKVKSATAHFYVDDSDQSFPERYFYGFDANVIELDGTIEIEGFLHILPDDPLYDINNQLVEFLPCESKLPISSCNPDDEKGYVTPLSLNMLYGNDDFLTYGDSGLCTMGYLCDVSCDMGGINKGDIAYARVTLDNICVMNNTYSAELVNVELLSDILAHDEDVE